MADVKLIGLYVKKVGGEARVTARVRDDLGRKVQRRFTLKSGANKLKAEDVMSLKESAASDFQEPA